MFLQDFSTLLEHLITVPDHLIFIRDFNVHMDDLTNSDAAKFAALIESAGLHQRVCGATHKRGHTLDLFIHREDDALLAGNIDIVSDMPSDHFAVICPCYMLYVLAMEKPKPSKLTIKCRKLCRIDMEIFRSDILDSSLHATNKTFDVNALITQYNSIMRNLIDKHAPECPQSITLRANAHWYNDKLRVMKRHKRQAECQYVSTGMEIHRQIYRDSCKKYTDALDAAKSNYDSTKIAPANQNQLFQMISGLFTVKPERPLPSHTSLLCLTKSFNNYFTTRIAKLRDNFAEINNTSSSVLVPLEPVKCFSTFSSFTQVPVSYIHTGVHSQIET